MPTLPTVTTLTQVRELIKALPGPDEAALAVATAREPQLTKPQGSLGTLESLAAWTAAWQGTHPPRMSRPQAYVFAGNHGIVNQGVSAFPAEVTHQMVLNFEHGGAAVNQMCAAMGVELSVHSLDLDNPTKDFSIEPAMTDEQCAAAMQIGMNAVQDTADVVCLGEMGIGNTTASAAICLALYGGDAQTWVGPGTGVDAKGVSHKASVIDAAVTLHKASLTDGLEILRHFGGREMAAIAGAVLAARLKRIPVLLDGYVSTAAAAPLNEMVGNVLDHGVLDHCQVGHVSQEPGHQLLLKKMGKTALQNFNMRLGEATGAVLAVGVLKAAVACHSNMATFGEAGVSDKGD